MSVELEEARRHQEVEIEGLDLEGWADLSLEERKERILESGRKDLPVDDFLALFQEADDEQKEETAASLVAEGVELIDTTEESRPQKSTEEKLPSSEPLFVKGLPEPDENTDRQIKEGDTLGLYLREAGKVPLLKKEEEVALFKRIERGRKASERLVEGQGRDKERRQLQSMVDDGWAAREHLLTANPRLVTSIAKKYMGRGVPFADLVQEGNIGLIRSVKKFDYRRGHKFSTYATWWIRQSVSRAVADYSRTIRIPVHAHDMIVKISRTGQHLEQELDRWPTTEEIAHELKLPQEKVEELIKANRPPLSLEEPVGEEEDSELGDFIEDEDAEIPSEATTQNLLNEDLSKALETLPPREALVLGLRKGMVDGISYTLEQIGRRMGITRERVRQIEAQALERLRHPSHKRKLIGYLEE